jgi:hypothetical protein
VSQTGRDVGGYVLEVTIEPGPMTGDPVGLAQPFTTEAIPPRRVRVLGT